MQQEKQHNDESWHNYIFYPTFIFKQTYHVSQLLWLVEETEGKFITETNNEIAAEFHFKY